MKSSVLLAMIVWMPELALCADPDLRVTIHLSDTAGVSNADLSEARQEADYILGKAGVEVTWLNCTPTVTGMLELCGRQSPTDLWILVVTEQLPGLNANALGSTLVEAEVIGRSYVFYSQVQALAIRFDTSKSLILGVAMSHEIGHVLLGAQNAHSGAGIMTGRWNWQDFRLARQGSLLFAEKQAKRIRAEVKRRNDSAISVATR